MEKSLEIGAILMGLFGGLAIFLYGMELMTGALKASSGQRLRRLLARMTTNRFKGVLAGAVTTAIIQSSSVTTVLVVGFVSAGLMKLEQTIPIIMGASIGTTVTAQIIAFKITHYALLIVTAGFAMQFLARNEVVRRTGTMIFGFGLIFFGMSLMGEATAPLRDYPPFIELLRQMDHPLYGILLSALFTAVVQSSSATTGVIIMLGSQGLISL
ncbi:MAG TPA: Na/Pi cotransporter family protein, partial [Thiolapillus brandeum]|nr:Na/Pi cotransporter family protein [Thiolapillus brandeum]